MANLRTNNLSGEQGKNAYRGSVFFSGADDYIDISDSVIAAAIPGGDEPYTIEMWVLFGRGGSAVDSGGSDSLIAYGSNSTRSYNGIDWTGTAIRNVWFGDDLSYTVDLVDGAWHHIAATYDQTTRRLFVDGVLGASDTPSDHSVGTTNNGKIGASTGGVINRDFKGYISNLRITKRAIYTAAFTPPTRELTAVDDTMLLCCQDSDNVLQEATGKTITGYGRYEYLNDTELVTNGSGLTTTGWTNQHTSTFTVEDGMIKVTRSGGTGPTAYQTITTVTGQQYTVSANIQYVSGNYADLRVYNGSDSSGTLLKFLRSTGTSTDGNISSTFTAESTSTSLFFTFDNGGDTGKFSQISVKAADRGKQPEVIPPFGVDAGNTFGGPIQQSTEGYMYFPTGRTEERGRGRAVFLGGGDPQVTTISFTNIQSLGNAQNFGSLTTVRSNLRGGSSSTRGLSAHSASAVDNTIEFITIATEGNSIDFGDMSGSSTSGATGTNDTRAVFWIGTNPSTNVIDFATIASLGNTADFGDMNVGVRHIDAMNSPTRCVIPGGWTSSGVNTNTIQFITFATTGNAQDFGGDVDYSGGIRGSGGISSPTRGVFAGGADSPSSAAVNIIHFVTLASTGNSTDFGDMLAAKRIEGGGTSSHIRGIIAGSNSPDQINTIEFVTIATTGNSQDFGDLMSSRSQDGYVGALSDCHGGLS